MKFGKDLQQYIAPGWESDYIDYKGLKVILKKLSEPDCDLEEIDGEFFMELEENLEKVNRAFLTHCSELEAALEQDSSASVERLQISAPSTPTSQRRRSSSAVKKEEGSSSRQDDGPKPAVAGESSGDTKQEFYDAYRTLGRLQTFVWINIKGFQKIMKKYDKRHQLRGTGNELGPEFDKRLEKEAFCSGKIEVLTELFKSRRPGGIVPMPNELGLSRDTGAAPGPAGQPRLAMQLITGNANPELAEEISARLGVPLTSAKIGRFDDGEVSIQILQNVRNSDLFIIQPTCPPVNDNLMELLLMASAVRRSAASRVTAVVPYYGYARQDRKERSRVPISAADVAKLMEAVVIDRVCCVDLHCGQIQGFFGPRTPVDNLWATPIAISYFMTRNLQNIAVVSPDAGGVARAKMFREGLEAQGLRASLAMIIKQRVGEPELVGQVEGCDCIIVDDMIDTADTLCAAANELVSLGAHRIFAFATHGLFSGSAADALEACPIEELVVANTIPLPPEVNRTTRKVRQVSVGKLLAQAIKCIHTGDSVSGLFDTKSGDALLA